MKDLIGKVKKFGEEATEILKDVQEAGLMKHTVTKDDTLSSIALKYYGHATEKYWKIIYNFNKQIALTMLTKAGVHLTTVEMAMFEMLRDAKHPRFKQLASLIK